MQDHCYVKRFTFDQAFQSYQIDQFLLDFFHNNPNIKVLSTGDRWATLGKVTQVTKEETLHSVTSLSFFDRLKKGSAFHLQMISVSNKFLVSCFQISFGQTETSKNALMSITTTFWLAISFENAC